MERLLSSRSVTKCPEIDIQVKTMGRIPAELECLANRLIEILTGKCVVKAQKVFKEFQLKKCTSIID